MTNPTSNYSWQMPTSTDLVTDLPADFEVFGQAVDNTMATMVAKTIFDAKGDIIAATGADAVSRLAVGATNGMVLTVDSAEATGLKYTLPSGGMTLLSTTTLSGTTTTLSSINQSYNSLFLVITGLTANTGNEDLAIRPNAATTECSYAGVRRQVNTTANANGSQNDEIFLTFFLGTDRTSSANSWAIRFDNYTSTTSHKPFSFYGAWNNGGSNSSSFGGSYQSNSAITSLVFRYGGYSMTGGTVLLYGVK
jgi:hypothetical protein